MTIDERLQFLTKSTESLHQAMHEMFERWDRDHQERVMNERAIMQAAGWWGSQMTTIESAAAILGRRGGAARSAAKTEAVRANGKLGGRPRSKSKRCPCGAMTLKRAQARGHHC